jgi:hypothetical protein
MTQPQTSVVGSAVTLGAGTFSFFGSTLPVVQWMSAFLGVIVGLATLVHLFKNWDKSK